MIQRILAHNIVWQGRTYHMHIAELDPETGKVTMRAFDHEIPSTYSFQAPFCSSRSEFKFVGCEI